MKPVDQAFSRALIEKGLLQAYMNLIDSSAAKVRSMVVWSLRTILVRSTEQIELCYNLGLLRNVIIKMSDDTD